MDAAGARGLLLDIGTLWLDRGYDSEITWLRRSERSIDDAIIAKKRKQGDTTLKQNQPVSSPWPVERTNSWLSNDGQLRRNTDGKPEHRLVQRALAVAYRLPASLIDWRNCWSPAPPPIR